MRQKPEEFVKDTLKKSLFFSSSMGVFFFFIFSVFHVSLALIPISVLVIFTGLFMTLIQSPLVEIRKRERELEKEVLFAGRFLQIKLHSGKPLLNALVEASKSYGVAGKYFKEIVDDINMGTPIEIALDNAMKYTPSEKFKKIIFQIGNSLRIGIDVSKSLDVVLDEIAKEQLLDIRRYSKKLGSLSLFYMLAAIVVPPLATAVFAVVGALIGFLSDTDSAETVFLGIALLLLIIQFMFIAIFKNSRLAVHV